MGAIREQALESPKRGQQNRHPIRGRNTRGTQSLLLSGIWGMVHGCCAVAHDILRLAGEEKGLLEQLSLTDRKHADGRTSISWAVDTPRSALS